MKTHVQKCISCPKLVKDKYPSKLHVSSTSTIESDEASEIENWLLDFSTCSAKSIPKKPKQVDACLTLVHFADKMSTSEQEKLNALLARAMYASGTPFCMVENSPWQAFFKVIRPAYVVPSRYEVSEPLLVSEYEKTREEMLIKVAESDVVAIMCDRWSNIRHEPIINFLLSVPQSVLWKLIYTEMQSHTGEYIAEAVSGVIDEVKQECGKMPTALVTDNTSNMKKSWKLLGEKYSELICYYGYAAHSMNLIFSDRMKLETLKKVKHQAKQIVKEFKSKHMLVDLLKSMQEVAKVNVTLKLPVKKRWGSAVTCLEIVQKIRLSYESLLYQKYHKKAPWRK